jgi:hypothetical protein
VTKHIAYISPGGQLHDEFFAPNDATPSPTGAAKIAQALNAGSCTMKKLILLKAQNHLALESGGTLGERCWPHFFHTGENTTGIVMRYGVVATDAGPSGPQEVVWEIREHSAGTAADALVGSATHMLTAETSSGAIAPNQVSHRTMVIRGLTANTQYHGLLNTFEGARMVYACVHEQQVRHGDDTVTGVCSPDKFHVEGPIYDEHSADLSDACNKLWRHNRSPLFTWTCDYYEASATVPSTNSTSYVNILGTSAPVYIQTQYKGTRRNPSAIACKMAVKLVRTAGTGTASVRLYDGTNSMAMTGLAIATNTPTWFVGDVTISDTPASWEMQALVSAGTTTVEILGWVLYPYVA